MFKTIKTDKVKVEWKTVCNDPNSPFANISGVETFEEDENESHIEIKIPQEARNVTKDNFDIVLSDPKPSTSVVDKNNKCSVTVDNDVIEAVISLAEDSIKANQTDAKVDLLLRREKEHKGRINVPWKAIPQSSDSVYANLTGSKCCV